MAVLVADETIEIDALLIQEAEHLDKSALNRSNIAFSRLSQKIARQLLLAAAPSSTLLKALESKHAELADAYNNSDEKKNRPPFCCVEGVKYAIDATKFGLVQKEPGHVKIVVPFYCEFERGMPFSADTNPNGEDSPIQKLEEVLFLLSFNKDISMELIFVNDVIAEKKDKDGGGSAKLFQESLSAYIVSKNMKTIPDNKGGFEALNGQLCVKFTSCEAEAIRGSSHETPDEKRKRFENRDSSGKMRERKGGAVLAGMEMEDLPTKFLVDDKRVVKCLVDGDCAHPVASFVGDAAYSILELGHTAYLGNLKHPHTIVSVVGKEKGGGDAATQARVQNRKLFFSGFIVPFLFPELTLKYNYTGTTQLPIKAFRGDINFAKAKLPTVQPNVDLGMLALLCSYLNNDGGGGSIGSGSVTIRDNIASSTMTTSDLGSEWTKTYGPIFTSAVVLCRELKPAEFEQLPQWLTSFIENMELHHYTTLFGATALDDANVVELFATMRQFRDAPDRAAVLQKLQVCFDKIFPPAVA